jgi:hypothetical protein
VAAFTAGFAAGEAAEWSDEGAAAAFPVGLRLVRGLALDLALDLILDFAAAFVPPLPERAAGVRDCAASRVAPCCAVRLREPPARDEREGRREPRRGGREDLAMTIVLVHRAARYREKARGAGERTAVNG